MKKLVLNLDALEVEAFEVDERRGSPRGTVLAAQLTRTLPPCCVTFTCGDSQIRPCLGG